MVELLSNRYTTQEADCEEIVWLHKELTSLEHGQGIPEGETQEEAIKACCLAIQRLRPRVHDYARQQLRYGSRDRKRMQRLLSM